MDNRILPEEAAVLALKENGLHIAFAESCTGGGVASRITDVAGASAVFECGIVCYSNNIKHSVLGVSEETLKKFGAVSEQTAAELSNGVRKISNADIGVSVTGFAGPTADEPGKSVGLIYIGISDSNSCKVIKLETNDSADGCRYRNRKRAQDEIFTLISEFINNR